MAGDGVGARCGRIAVMQMMALFLVLMLAACASLPSQGYPVPGAAALPGAADKAALRVLYVTDRAPRDLPGGLAYDTARNPSMALGQAILARRARGQAERRLSYRLTALEEWRRFPPTPVPFSARDGRILPEPEAQAAYDAAARDFQTRIARAMRVSGRDEVLIYIHGFNSQFRHAAATLAEIWAATDRRTLPLAYTWPAGNPGPFGYFKDRESGDFSVFHLKETLRLLAGVKGLRAMHIVAHSRGAEVATEALRERIIAVRASGGNALRSLKVRNLVLAAPDLDFGVVRQRLLAERFGPAFGRITVYMNPEDDALGLAQTLLTGQRFGRLSLDDLRPAERRIFRSIGNVDFINVSAVAVGSSHGYFRDNLEVRGDIVTLLSTDAPPGDPARTRNLQHEGANFWRLLTPTDLARVLPDVER